MHYLLSLFKTISDIFFPLIADNNFGEFCDFNPSTQAFKTLCGFAEPRDLATTSCIPKTSHTDLIAPPAIIPVPAGAGGGRRLPVRLREEPARVCDEAGGDPVAEQGAAGVAPRQAAEA